jgi:hypothetical protein
MQHNTCYREEQDGGHSWCNGLVVPDSWHNSVDTVHTYFGHNFRNIPQGTAGGRRPDLSQADVQGHMLGSYPGQHRHKSHMIHGMASTRHPGLGNCEVDIY